MGAQYFTALAARSRYHHKTLVGNILFYVPLIVLIISGFVLKDANKQTRNIIRAIAVVCVLLSYVAEFVFSK